MKKLILINTLLILFSAACGCTKDKMQDELPSITQTGANTFGLVYDGVVFTPTDAKSRGFGIDGGPTSGLAVFGYYYDTEHYSNGIEAIRYSNIKNLREIYIHIYQLESLGIGTYLLGNYGVREGFRKPYNNYIWIYGTSSITGELVSYCSYENSGEVNITRKDEDNNIFSGTFYGKLKSADGTEVIEITDGRFDINKRKVNSK